MSVYTSQRAWLATVEKFPGQARLEAERWLSISYPLFRRLAFFAATNIGLFTPPQALDWLLADEHWWPMVGRDEA